MRIPKSAREKCTRYLVIQPPAPGADRALRPPLAPPAHDELAADAALDWLAHVQAGRIPVR